LTLSSYGQVPSRKMMGLLCCWEGTVLQSTGGCSLAKMLGGPSAHEAAVQVANAFAATCSATSKETWVLALRWRL
jgi:hypothetical protein